MGIFVIFAAGLILLGLQAWGKVSELVAESKVAQDELLEGGRMLKVAGPSLTESQAAAALSAFQKAGRHFRHVHDVLVQSRIVTAIAFIPWVSGQVQAAQSLTDMGQHLSRIGEVGVEVAAAVSSGAPMSSEGHLHPGEKLLAGLQALDPKLGLIASELNQAKADRTRIPRSGLLPQLSGAVRRFDSTVNLSSVEQSVAQLRADEAAIRALLGAEHASTYLVLEQDPAELRATGGFVGTVGFLQFDHGRMAPFEPKNVYDIDRSSQSRSIVEPPRPFQVTFHLNSWQLRDSNWSPDFPTAAHQAETFLSSEAHREVDGVVAIDPFFIQNVLSVTGPVQIPETGDVVDEHNFFQLSLTRIEGLHGSTSVSKMFLSQAAKAIFARLTAVPPGKWFSLLQVFQRGCDSRSLQAYFHNDVVETMVSRHHCDGRLQPIVGDGVMIVDSNVGGNKDDFWMKRGFNLSLQVQPDGSVTHTLGLHYEGISPHDPLTGTWGYTGWLRVYLPPSAIVRSVSGASLSVSTDLGRRLLQGWLYVQFDHAVDVTIVYDIDGQALHSSKHRLELLWQKQAGRLADPISVELSLAPGWKLQSGRMGSTKVTGDKITSDLSVDRGFSFDYQPP